MRDLMDKVNEWSLEDIFDGLFEPAFYSGKHNIMHMKTDVKEDENGYELDIDLPGFEKNEIDVTLKNGYLNVSAKKVEKTENNTKEEHKHNHESKHDDCEHKIPDECGCDDDCNCGCKETEHCECNAPKRYIKRERSFYASRSYYVGEKVREDDIKAKYQNGVLSLYVPKQKAKEITSHKINID